MACAALVVAGPATAQEETREPWRYRITVGPQVYPSYPGSDSYDVGPYVNIDRARGDQPFEFEAPDQGFGFSVVESGGFSIGPVVNWEGVRKAKHVGADVPTIKFSIEPGVFAGLELGESFRLRGELRKGVTGHKGWIGVAGADWVARDGDRWLFSLGPRITWSDSRYQDAWFGITPETSVATGLPAYDPDSGVQAVGATASFLTEVGPNWGISAYAKYDRLVGDAADSPLVRVHGSRDQLSGGLALSYTWGGRE
ncbi:MAG TPA: MipA/OmpV family protein [Croceibacterium sp.]|nr:MipA/OmpV family protein [Croceibacterium sp.]